MGVQKLPRCPHYQMHTEPLKMEGPASYLAVRRCLLTERLVQLLHTTEDGNQFAAKLVIMSTEDRAYAFVGPDLEAVTQTTCTVRRCEGHCTPAYSTHLEAFGLSDPHETEVTCSDTETLSDSENSPASAK